MSTVMVVSTTSEDERELRIPLLWRGPPKADGVAHEEYETLLLVSEDINHFALRAPLQRRGIREMEPSDKPAVWCCSFTPIHAKAE
jgi:hypothetical protein